MEYPLINKKSNFNAVILADGDYPTNEITLAILNNAKMVICCDGAAGHYTGKPYAIIGDGDSLSDDFKKRYADIFHQIDEQDDNDLTKATRFAIEILKNNNEELNIAYLGCTGKREDHTLANISLMMHFFSNYGITSTMITDHGYFNTVNGNATFDSFKGQQVSIFNFGCNKLESIGLKWNSYPYKWLWQGTLNEATTTKFSFMADNNYMVFRTFDAKSPINLY
nr:thiamine diphosphokinase [Prevotella sp.]